MYAYVVGLLVFLILFRAFWTPDLLFLMLLGLFVLLGQGKRFIRDFLPFVAVIVIYDSFRGIADTLQSRVHVTEMIAADKWLGGGTLPTVRLQDWLYSGQLAWYDFAFHTVYMLHFIAPLILGVLIWKYRARLYWPYVTGFVILSLAAFVTYAVFPAAPPWMAAEMGVISGVHRMITDIWLAYGAQSFPTLYTNLSPNEVAAVPSLHVAYPVLIAMFAWRAFGRRIGLATLAYPLVISFGVVYIGEHYLIDVVLGLLYAGLAYLATVTIYHYAASPQRHLTPVMASALVAVLLRSKGKAA